MPDTPHYINHRQRLRERFRKTGADGMHDYELLELLLTFSIPRRDVKPVAKKLISEFGGLPGVLDADQKKLEELSGVGSMSSTLIHLVKEMYSTYLAEKMKKGDLLSSPESVLKFVRVSLSGMMNEAFMVIYVNVKNEVIDHSLLHEGTVDNVAVYPRRIIESALSRNSAGIILVHNHPSGNPRPSPEDRALTNEIVDAAKTLDIRVLDHIIVGKDGYFSFMENDLLTAAKA
ncbi:MAG TPA: DNA repair protein RadC [Thermodesulfobacteriota bacterium]|nr:DNA repair protein RadC [Thermodesulfobacteriota bacterium]